MNEHIPMVDPTPMDDFMLIDDPEGYSQVGYYARGP